ncbi:hypothetical protein ABBQ32_008831 [Trebouxia sp. C0010 RCD-2024]
MFVTKSPCAFKNSLSRGGAAIESLAVNAQLKEDLLRVDDDIGVPAVLTDMNTPQGRPHSKSWVLKVVGQMWVDKCAQETRSRTSAKQVAKEDCEFYQMLLANTAMACQPPSITTIFTDGEASPNLRITPATDTVKAVFKHLEDSEGCRDFFASTFENLQDAKAGTIPAEPLMQALLDQYLKRMSVNRATLKAQFAAGDTDSDGLLDRPQARAALLCAQPSLSDTVLNAIWLEQEKYAVSEAVAKDAVDVDAFVDAARTHDLGMWKIDCRQAFGPLRPKIVIQQFGGPQLATPTSWRPCTPTGPFRDTLFQQLTDAATSCKPNLAEQVQQLNKGLPLSARKDGSAMEAQLSHFQELLKEGNDAEAAFLAEQLLISQMQYLITMYVPDNPPVVDPYAASALCSSSRPVSPLVAPGGMRGPAIQTAESSARWAAAALRGSIFPQSRAVPGSAFGASRDAGKSNFPAAAAKVAAMAAITAGDLVPILAQPRERSEPEGHWQALSKGIGFLDCLHRLFGCCKVRMPSRKRKRDRVLELSQEPLEQRNNSFVCCYQQP